MSMTINHPDRLFVSLFDLLYLLYDSLVFLHSYLDDFVKILLLENFRHNNFVTILFPLNVILFIVLLCLNIMSSSTSSPSSVSISMCLYISFSYFPVLTASMIKSTGSRNWVRFLCV